MKIQLNITVFIIVLLFLFEGITHANNDLLHEATQNKSFNKGNDKTIEIENFEQFLSLRPLPEYTAIDEELISKRLDEYITHELLYAEALRHELENVYIKILRIKTIIYSGICPLIDVQIKRFNEI